MVLTGISVLKLKTAKDCTLTLPFMLMEDAASNEESALISAISARFLIL